MLPKAQLEPWREFYDAARQNKVLDGRTTLLIHLASAMAMGCSP
jgi:hypothetical protein